MLVHCVILIDGNAVVKLDEFFQISIALNSIVGDNEYAISTIDVERRRCTEFDPSPTYTRIIDLLVQLIPLVLYKPNNDVAHPACHPLTTGNV